MRIKRKEECMIMKGNMEEGRKKEDRERQNRRKERREKRKGGREGKWNGRKGEEDGDIREREEGRGNEMEEMEKMAM